MAEAQASIASASFVGMKRADTGRVVAVFNGVRPVVLYSDDEGESWIVVPDTPTDVEILDFALAGDGIFLASKSAVFVSFDDDRFGQFFPRADDSTLQIAQIDASEDRVVVLDIFGALWWIDGTGRTEPVNCGRPCDATTMRLTSNRLYVAPEGGSVFGLPLP